MDTFGPFGDGPPPAKRRKTGKAAPALLPNVASTTPERLLPADGESGDEAGRPAPPLVSPLDGKSGAAASPDGHASSSFSKIERRSPTLPRNRGTETNAPLQEMIHFGGMQWDEDMVTSEEGSSSSGPVAVVSGAKSWSKKGSAVSAVAFATRKSAPYGASSFSRALDGQQPVASDEPGPGVSQSKRHKMVGLAASSSAPTSAVDDVPVETKLRTKKSGAEILLGLGDGTDSSTFRLEELKEWRKKDQQYKAALENAYSEKFDEDVIKALKKAREANSRHYKKKARQRLEAAEGDAGGAASGSALQKRGSKSKNAGDLSNVDSQHHDVVIDDYLAKKNAVGEEEYVARKLQELMGMGPGVLWQALEDVLKKTTFPIYKGDVEKMMFGSVPRGNKNGAKPHQAWGSTHRPNLLKLITHIIYKINPPALLGFKYATLQILKNGKKSWHRDARNDKDNPEAVIFGCGDFKRGGLRVREDDAHLPDQRCPFDSKDVEDLKFGDACNQDGETKCEKVLDLYRKFHRVNVRSTLHASEESWGGDRFTFQLYTNESWRKFRDGEALKRMQEGGMHPPDVLAGPAATGAVDLFGNSDDDESEDEEAGLRLLEQEQSSAMDDDYKELLRVIWQGLFPHQRKCWVKTHSLPKCLVEMFPGTGKTWTVIHEILFAFERLNVIVVPWIALIIQFVEDYFLTKYQDERDEAFRKSKEALRKLFRRFSLFVFCSGQETDDILLRIGPMDEVKFSSREDELRDFVRTSNESQRKALILVTYASLARFQRVIIKEKANIGRLFYDEAHHILSEKKQKMVFENDAFNDLCLHRRFYTGTPTNANGIVMKPSESGQEGHCGPVGFQYGYAQARKDGRAKDLDVVVVSLSQRSKAGLGDNLPNYNEILKNMARVMLASEWPYVNLLLFSKQVQKHDHEKKADGKNTRSQSSVEDFEPHLEKFAQIYEEVRCAEFPQKPAVDAANIITESITKDTKANKRGKILKNFDKQVPGRIYIVSSCMVLREGVDTKYANFIAGDLGTSYIIIVQKIGRALRKTPGLLREVKEMPAKVILNVEVDFAKIYAEEDEEARHRALLQEMDQSGDFNEVLRVVTHLQHGLDFHQMLENVYFPGLDTLDEISDRLRAKFGKIVLPAAQTLSDLLEKNLPDEDFRTLQDDQDLAAAIKAETEDPAVVLQNVASRTGVTQSVFYSNRSSGFPAIFAPVTSSTGGETTAITSDGSAASSTASAPFGGGRSIFFNEIAKTYHDVVDDVGPAKNSGDPTSKAAAGKAEDGAAGKGLRKKRTFIEFQLPIDFKARFGLEPHVEATKMGATMTKDASQFLLRTKLIDGDFESRFEAARQKMEREKLTDCMDIEWCRQMARLDPGTFFVGPGRVEKREKLEELPGWEWTYARPKLREVLRPGHGSKANGSATESAASSPISASSLSPAPVRVKNAANKKNVKAKGAPTPGRKATPAKVAPVKKSGGGKAGARVGGCTHGKLKRSLCLVCCACPHGKLKTNCKVCCVCPHGKLKRGCKVCSGCPHGNLEWDCKECSGCPHGKLKRSCKVCNACPHGKLKKDCRVCNGCPHGKLKNGCKECSGCPHGRLKRACKVCKAVLDRRNTN